MRVVVDVNVLISAILSPTGSPARLLDAWREGRFELVVSPLLLAELTRALSYPKLSRYITPSEAAEYLKWISHEALLVEDPAGAPVPRSADPDDDYLIALAELVNAMIVSGDDHLLDLRDELPILAPAAFIEELNAEEQP